MSGRRNTKHDVELLQRPLLCLWNHKKDDQERQQVETRIQAESARWSDLRQQRGECQAKSTADCIIYANCESSSNLAVRQRERFGEIDGRDGPDSYD